MPVVFRHKGFRFLFYSNEGDPREPIQIHAVRDGVDAKFWLWPEVNLAYNDGHKATDLPMLAEVIFNRRSFIAGALNEFFSACD